MNGGECSGGLGPRLAAGLLWLALALLTGPTVRADWAGFARFGAVAEVAVEERSVHVHLRLRDKALPELARLAGPDAAEVPPERLAGRLLVLRDGAGQRLSGRTAAPLAAAIPAVRAEGAAAPETYRETEFDFPLPERTEALTIEPPAGASDKDIGLVVLHRGVPAGDLAALDKPATLRLDWSDPWKSRFDDPALGRHHAEPRSFIYVEPYEVRHEILIRVRDLLPRLNVRPADPRRIEAQDQERLKEAIGRHLAAHNPMRIDGSASAPELDRVEFVRFDRQGVQVLRGGEPLDSTTALAGIILVYLTDQPARNIALSWESFGADENRRPVTVLYGIESFESYVTRRDPVFRWTSDEVFRVPGAAAAPSAPEPATPRVSRSLAMGLRYAGAAIAVAALAAAVRNRKTRRSGMAAEFALLLALAGCVGFYPEIARIPDAATEPAEPLPEDAARAELHALLHNVYRAFQIRGEEAAYDRLALSLDGDILEEIFLRQRQTLETSAQGLGGEGRVNRIEILDSRITRAAPRTLRIDARWVAHGSVSHWGHSHERSNEYQAHFVLSPGLEGRWKITGVEFLDAQRRNGTGSSL